MFEEIERINENDAERDSFQDQADSKFIVERIITIPENDYYDRIDLKESDVIALINRIWELYRGYDRNDNYGICGNLDSFYRQRYLDDSITDSIFVHLGYRELHVYPIEGKESFDRNKESGTLWYGWQKRKRRKLLMQMIDYLEGLRK